MLRCYKLQDQFNVFARDKYGNKVLWNMWTRSNVSMKITIAESLGKKLYSS